MGKINKKSFGEILRFGIVGSLAVAIQYGVYLLCLQPYGHNLSFALSYVVSFLFNYILSVYFTFNVKSSTKRLLGFIFSHIINFCCQNLFLNLFIYIGISKEWAMIPVFVICVPLNFVLVRYFLKR